MRSEAAWLAELPRLILGAIALTAFGLIVAAPAPPAIPVAMASIPPPSAESVPVRWDIRTGGWLIQVDGVQLAFDSPEQLMATKPGHHFELTLSDFDQLIARHADAEGFDWRLIAAVIFEESRFDPSIRSHRGAFGLMQVREIAARHMGEDFYHLPEDNVRTGVRYLSHLREEFANAADDDLRFALAAYNVGPGHIRDAQKLAEELGGDPNRWFGGIRETLPLLERKYYSRRARHGYAQGRSAIEYVERVLERFREYQRATTEFDLSRQQSLDPNEALG